MKIQSLSVVVPGGCPNRCRFCVSVLHPNPMPNHIEQNKRFRDLYKADYQKRLMFARDNGCNTVMLTGNGEPVLNENFLNFFSEWNKQLPNPFRWVELQTAGLKIDDEKLRWLRNEIGVNTISLSLSNVFSSDLNAEYNVTPEKMKVDINQLCNEIRRYDFTLRLSLNLTDLYNDITPKQLFDRCKQLGANQITFRVLYESDEDDKYGVNQWIRDHRVKIDFVTKVNLYIIENGRRLERLPFGAWRYSVDGMSVVVDDDCMSIELKDEVELVKYLILQPNCKLYTKWDDEGSLLF